MGDWLEAHQFETVQDNRTTAIFTTGIKIITRIAGSVPNHDSVSIINQVDYLAPNHFTDSLGITANVNTGPDFKQPDRKTASQPRRRIVNRDDQHRRLTLPQWQ